MKSIRKINQEIVVLVLSILIFGGCDRNKLGEQLGPALCPSDRFEFVSPFTTSSGDIDFASGESQLISSEFNEEVSWEVTLKGTTSNAQKVYAGRSKSIAIHWRGNADEGYPFFTNENCMVELKLACREPIQTSFNMSPNTFSNFGYLIQNYDGIGKPVVMGNPSGTNLVVAKSGIKPGPVDPSPQGGNYYCMVGNSGTTETWYFGGVSTTGAIPADIKARNPSDVYFNLFINGNSTKNSLLTITFKEGPDLRNKNINPDWEGWRMYSFKLSEAGVKDVSKITTIDYSLGTALTKGTSAEFYMDFLIMTVDAPFYEL